MTYKVTESDGSAKRAIQEMREARAQLCNKVLRLLQEFEEVWGAGISDVEVRSFDTIDANTGVHRTRTHSVLMKVQL